MTAASFAYQDSVILVATHYETWVFSDVGPNPNTSGIICVSSLNLEMVMKLLTCQIPTHQASFAYQYSIILVATHYETWVFSDVGQNPNTSGIMTDIYKIITARQVLCRAILCVAEEGFAEN